MAFQHAKAKIMKSYAFISYIKGSRTYSFHVFILACFCLKWQISIISVLDY